MGKPQLTYDGEWGILSQAGRSTGSSAPRGPVYEMSPGPHREIARYSPGGVFTRWDFSSGGEGVFARRAFSSGGAADVFFRGGSVVCGLLIDWWRLGRRCLRR